MHNPRFNVPKQRFARPRLGRVGIGALLLLGGLSTFIAPPLAGASGKVNTFQLSNGLTGTLTMTPTTQLGCQSQGYVSDLTGNIKGIKANPPKTWLLAINATSVGTYKASDSINSKAHVTLQPPTGNAGEDTLTNIGGTLKITGAGAASGTINLKMESVNDNLKTTIKGSWSCPPGT
jgi:hypothetical protein